MIGWLVAFILYLLGGSLSLFMSDACMELDPQKFHYESKASIGVMRWVAALFWPVMVLLVLCVTGDGVQPWDTTLEEGWGPHAAAFCVIRYLRRSKLPEHSLESARWYYTEIHKHARDEIKRRVKRAPWVVVKMNLNKILTDDEKKLLGIRY